MRSITVCIVLSLCFWIGTGQAQDFMKDRDLVAKAYEAITDFEIKSEVAMYDKWSSTNPNEVQKSEAYKKGDRYFYKMGENIMLSNEKGMLVIRPRQKMMIFSPKVEGKDKGDPLVIEVDEGVLPNMGEVMDRIREKVEYVGTEDGLKHYRLGSDGGHLARMDIFIDAKTFFIMRMEYYYDESIYAGSSKMVMTYTKMDTRPIISDAVFSERKYIRETDGKISPVGIYKGYELIINKRQ